DIGSAMPLPSPIGRTVIDVLVLHIGIDRSIRDIPSWMRRPASRGNPGREDAGIRLLRRKRPSQVPAASLQAAVRESLVIVLGIHHRSQPELLHVAQARSLAGFLSCLGKNGEKNCGQDSNNRYHDKQFDERKTSALSLLLESLVH